MFSLVGCVWAGHCAAFDGTLGHDPSLRWLKTEYLQSARDKRGAQAFYEKRIVPVMDNINYHVPARGLDRLSAAGA